MAHGKSDDDEALSEGVVKRSLRETAKESIIFYVDEGFAGVRHSQRTSIFFIFIPASYVDLATIVISPPPPRLFCKKQRFEKESACFTTTSLEDCD